jgi:hypothetical protein
MLELMLFSASLLANARPLPERRAAKAIFDGSGRWR